MLSSHYKELYENYYTDAPDKKRELTAIGTLDHIRSLVGDKKFDSVVDVGAGRGAVIGLLQKENFARSITGLEILSSGLERILARALPNVTAVQFDGYKSEFPDKTFDLALSIHVLEHVEHERLYLKELARISRQAVIEVPLELTANCRKVMAVTGRCGHINFYQRETFENILRTSGLNIRSVVVNTVRRDLDIHMSGRARGVLKNVIRSTALRLNERLARFQFVYLCTAYVDCP